MKLRWHRLWPSSLQEARLSVLRRPITNSPLSDLIQKNLTRSAAAGLARLAGATPQLSADRIIDRVTDAMMEKVALLKRSFC